MSTQRSRRAIATPAAPAPLITTFISSNFLPTTFAALMSAANTTIAVPCWSSWKTGMPRSCRRSSISKLRGAAISSRLIPPKTGAIRRQVSTISSVSWVSKQIGKALMCPNWRNNIALPSITGIEAAAPILPKPKTAEPSVTIATQLLLIVYSQTFSGSLAISKQGAATPGEYTKERCSEVRTSILLRMPIFPFNRLCNFSDSAE